VFTEDEKMNSGLQASKQEMKKRMKIEIGNKFY